MKKFCSFLVIAFTMFTIFLVNVTAAESVYNVVTCPGEDMATQMRINFQSTTGIENLKVKYTTSGDTGYANKVEVDAERVSFSRVNAGAATYSGFETPRYVWTAELNNLTPSTEYMYTITDGTTDYVGNYYFETGSNTSDEFSFMFLTDPQYANDTGASLFNKLLEDNLEASDLKFALITGDITDKGGNSAYWNMFYTKSSLTKMPFITTVGNHEYYDNTTTTLDNSIYVNFFNNPQNGPENVKGSSYYTMYNGVLIVMIDSEYRSSGTEQQDWFRDVCNSVSPEYIIVGTHKSSYTKGPYYSDGVSFRRQWQGVFDECGVDLVLSGHDHTFTRSYPIYNGKVSTNPNFGTTYILGGSAGQKYYPAQSTENDEFIAAYFDQKTVGTIITVGKDKITTKTVDIAGSVLDNGEVTKKRFGTIVDNFDKAKFESSFTIEPLVSDLTSGYIRFSTEAYGHVKSVSFFNKTANKSIGSVSVFNENMCQSGISEGFLLGEVQVIEATILYTDKTINTIELNLDNRIDWGSVGTVKFVSATYDTITLEWDQTIKSVYADRYTVYCNDKHANNIRITNSTRDDEKCTYVCKNLVAGTVYKFEISLVNLNGNVIWEGEITASTLSLDPEYVTYQRQLAYIIVNKAFEGWTD